MLTVISTDLELRGIVNKVSKNGTVYYVINAETQDGTASQFYCPDAQSLPQGLRKGDAIKIQFEVKTFKGNDKLVVRKVEKVG